MSFFPQQLLDTLQRGYPDRLYALVVGPTNWVVRALFSMLSPLMPQRLRAKIHLPPPRKLRAALASLGCERLPAGWF